LLSLVKCRFFNTISIESTTINDLTKVKLKREVTFGGLEGAQPLFFPLIKNSKTLSLSTVTLFSSALLNLNYMVMCVSRELEKIRLIV
jgi:hypothetical protein